MTLKDLLTAIGSAAHFSLQEEYDNSGIQVGDPGKEVKKALTCVDVTMEVLEEAEQASCDVIVSHHPLIFKAIKSITGRGIVERIIIEAIRRDISIVSAHTNLDAVHEGVNHILAKRLGLSGLQILDPKSGMLRKLVTFCPEKHAGEVRKALFDAGGGHIGAYDCCSFNIEGYGTFRAGSQASPFVGNINELHTEPEVRIELIFPAYLEQLLIKALQASHPYEEVAYDVYPLGNLYDRAGAGMIGSLQSPLEEEAFLDMIKERLQVPCLRHSPLRGKPVETVAVCGGSGGFLAGKAISAGADVFITAELKYNQFMDAGGKMLLVDAGHYETEQFTKELLAGIIQKKLINFAVLISQVNTNPVHYYGGVPRNY